MEPLKVKLREAETLVGLLYVDGVFDCAHLAVLAQRQLFGRNVGWPLDARHPRRLREQTAWIERHRDALADRIEQPSTGDVVLFLQTTEDGGEHHHIGTLFLHGGERWVLHVQREGVSSVLQREADCLRAGLRLEGYYRWRVVALELADE